MDNANSHLPQGASLGNFPLFAQTGCLNDDINNCYYPSSLRASDKINETVVAKPGYFAIQLNTSVKAEMTVTNHTALYRFTFPTDGTPTKIPSNGTTPYSPLILAELADLSGSRTDAFISVDPNTGRISGSGTFRPSFGIGNYNLYFCTDFQGAKLRNTGIFVNNRAGTDHKSFRTYDDGQSPLLPAGAWAQFHPPANNQILARVGLSFISTAQACSNAEREIPGFDFESVRADAEDAWRQKLSTIKVDNTGIIDSFQRTFWSGIYRTLISPQDYTGRTAYV